jgi:hypothetical protein
MLIPCPSQDEVLNIIAKQSGGATWPMVRNLYQKLRLTGATQSRVLEAPVIGYEGKKEETTLDSIKEYGHVFRWIVRPCSTFRRHGQLREAEGGEGGARVGR